MRHHRQTPPPKTDDALRAAVATWLASERSAVDPEAERTSVPRAAAEEALFAVFGALPGPLPSPGFADAVLVRAGVARSRDLGVHLRFLVAAAFVSTALAWTVLVPTAWALLDTVGPATALVTVCQEAIALFAGALHATIDLLSVGQGVATFARALWLLATSPQGAAFLLALTALTYGLSRWLVTLVATPRSFRHAFA